MFARLTDEQEAIRDAVREFAQKEIAPHADQWDEEHRFPRDIFRPMAEMGLAGLLAPEEYGGSQLPRLTGALIYEELGKANMGTAVWLSVHNMVTGIVSRFGDDEQRARWIPKHAGGEFARRVFAERGARRIGRGEPAMRGAARGRLLRAQRLEVLGDQRGRRGSLRRLRTQRRQRVAWHLGLRRRAGNAGV